MKIITKTCIILTGVFLTSPSYGQGLKGVWLDEDRKGYIEIYDCNKSRRVNNRSLMRWMCAKTKTRGQRLCGRVVNVNSRGKAELRRLKKKVSDVIGTPVLCVSPPRRGKKRWKGGLYSVYLDTRANGFVTQLSANRIRVKGCKFFESSVTCAKDIWTRVK